MTSAVHHCFFTVTPHLSISRASTRACAASATSPHTSVDCTGVSDVDMRLEGAA
jgi:hypothetical protein